ncbi:hypothetical protein ACA910_019056 [Epithemia clementina (nom. ined.)]
MILSKKQLVLLGLFALSMLVGWNVLLFEKTDIHAGSRKPRPTKLTQHLQRGRQVKTYSPYTYNKSLLEWPAGKAMEWERPGNCHLRPDYVPSVCCFGGIYQKNCGSNRSEHFSKLEDERLESESKFFNESSCHVCDVAEYLIRYNLTLTLEGDSVTAQSMVGLRCSLFRRGYRMTEVKRIDGGRNKSLWFKYGLTNLDVSRFVLNPKPFSSNDSSVATPIISGQIVYAQAYRAFEPHELAYVWNQSDIVVFDHGVHWAPQNLKTEFRKETADYLSTPRPPNLKLLAWRETTAQHFPGRPGGHYMLGVTPLPTCDPWPEVPQNGTNPQGLWIDLIEAANSTFLDGHSTGLNLFNIQKACQLANITLLNALDEDFLSVPLPNFSSSANKNQKNELVYFPTRPYQANLHDLHPGGEKSDCTHYCNTPILWEPTWRGLKRAMDRMFQHLDPTKDTVTRAQGFSDRLSFFHAEL